jgi:hypothetical protein
MNDKKDGFLNAHAFSNEKGAFGKFLLFLLPGFFGGTCFNDIIHGRLTWYSIGFFLVVSAISSILYFITECLAYRTKLFPKFKRRELFHLLSFFLLFVLSAAVFMAIML